MTNPGCGPRRAGSLSAFASTPRSRAAPVRSAPLPQRPAAAPRRFAQRLCLNAPQSAAPRSAVIPRPSI